MLPIQSTDILSELRRAASTELDESMYEREKANSQSYQFFNPAEMSYSTRAGPSLYVTEGDRRILKDRLRLLHGMNKCLALALNAPVVQDCFSEIARGFDPAFFQAAAMSYRDENPADVEMVRSIPLGAFILERILCLAEHHIWKVAAPSLFDLSDQPISEEMKPFIDDVYKKDMEKRTIGRALLAEFREYQQIVLHAWDDNLEAFVYNASPCCAKMVRLANEFMKDVLVDQVKARFMLAGPVHGRGIKRVVIPTGSRKLHCL
jgi:hypothetical protein